MTGKAGQEPKAIGPAFLAVLLTLGAAACSTPSWMGDADRTHVSSHWRVEAESASARVSFLDDEIDIDTPAGLTLWFLPELTSPVTIRFEAMAVAEGGPNDHVSDLNAFWMATNTDGSGGAARVRSGAFADYDTLKTYYIGIGGNRNSTTRMRRYVGVSGTRPLLPEHDSAAQRDMLVPGRWTTISLIARGDNIAVERDGRTLFHMRDPAPYRRGHFALRTTTSHLRIRNVRIER